MFTDSASQTCNSIQKFMDSISQIRDLLLF